MKSKHQLNNYSVYLPDSPLNTVWGLSVTSVGHANIQPESPYPPTDAGHPEDHTFNWYQGRTLDCWQILFIHSGQGVFDSKITGSQQLSQGDSVLLFPGVWHRYQPDPTTGWSESWIEFRGMVSHELTSQQQLSPAHPIYPTDSDPIVFDHLQRCHELANALPHSYHSHLATSTLSILSYLAAGTLAAGQATSPHEDKIRQAQEFISSQYHRALDVASLSSSLGISEPHFRRTFKARTGLAPKQYHTECRLRHVKALLSHTSQTIAEISEKTGYHSPFHLSAEFKKRNGSSPTEWRQNQNL